jgi:hypothetical protein
MLQMDWGDASQAVDFGEVGAKHTEGDAHVFVLVCPQNVVGNTIMTDLGEMVRFCRNVGV